MGEVMRKDFEGAYLKQYSRLPLGWDKIVQRYRDAHANGAWWAWQAATLKAFGDGHFSGFSAGVKYAASQTHEFDEARTDRIAASHGDGEHYDELK